MTDQFPIGTPVQWPEDTREGPCTRVGTVHSYVRRGHDLVAVLETYPGSPLMERPPSMLRHHTGRG